MDKDIKLLIKKRGTYKARLTNYLAYLDNLSTEITPQQLLEIELRTSKLEALYEDYDEIQLQIECSSESADEQCKEREVFEDTYYTALARARLLTSPPKPAGDAVKGEASGSPPSKGEGTYEVIDIENGKRLGVKQEGELWIKSPLRMKGYMGDPEATASQFDAEGYVRTGDIGYYDSDGHFYIVDRLKELIKYKGFQVAPAELEALLLQHRGIADCGVVGKPDEMAGELPLAFVVPQPGVTLTEKEIVEHVSKKVSPAKHLRGGVIFVTEIPKNASGKILRRDLRLLLQEKLKSKL